ncbi:hypothetical protein HYALB_00009210 [Hymenoscyphus albidus]|uniref:NDT80 domain-containing protein n=1 Tax=Hymenoscyphus albidus TaxID=595503 RepID=A0A9N9PWB7_9HELO|nr:hypothetical protein HYALB_00009210 [Hymenoscyphus albidus]
MSGYDHLPLASPSSNTKSNSNNIMPLTNFLPQSQIGSMDAFDHDLNFDGGNMFGHNRDDLTSNIPPIPFTPSYENSDGFSSTFEDPFSYPSAPFDTLLEQSNNNSHNNSNNNNGQPGETFLQALDNKLLGFSAPIIKAPILNDCGQTWPQMSAELYGMFFVAEDVFEGEPTGRPTELTCYRRNLFQISGTIALSRNISHILNEQGQQIPIYELTATLSARESIEGKSTEIISVPWKTAAGASSEAKAGGAPPHWPLNLSINPELDPSAVSIPIAWKRLQFKHATANNGRRKGLQQHYVIQINLIATIPTGETIKLAEIQSGPIIVRGRSPRNFDSRKDVPLSEKKSDAKQRTTSDLGQTPQVKVDPGATNNSYRHYALNQLQQPLDLPEWPNSSPSQPSPSSPESNRPLKKATVSSSSGTRPPVPRWNDPKGKKKRTQVAPVDLSLADEDPGRNGNSGSGERFSAGERSPDVRKKNSTTHLGSPFEDADLLYEYFPLTVDDWMPPVDAIYRPHVVHHIHPPAMMAQQVKVNPKRYFSAED